MRSMTHASFRYVPKWRSQNQSPARAARGRQPHLETAPTATEPMTRPSSVGADMSGYVSTAETRHFGRPRRPNSHPGHPTPPRRLRSVEHGCDCDRSRARSSVWLGRPQIPIEC